LLENITSELWKGALVSEVIFFPNPKPNDCNTQRGVTHMVSSFAQLVIKWKDEKGEICCSGSARISINPGLTT
jgi:hypothetical protein